MERRGREGKGKRYRKGEERKEKRRGEEEGGKERVDAGMCI